MTWKSRIAALLLALCCLTAALTGCGQSAAGTQDDADSKKVVIYTPTEDYLIEYIQQRLTAQLPDYDISLEYYHSGDLAAKLQAEGADTACDIVFDCEYGYLQMLSDNFATIDFIDNSQFVADMQDPTRRPLLRLRHRQHAGARRQGSSRAAEL